MDSLGVNSPGWHITYLGWSGFHVYKPATQNAEGLHLFIDPPKGTSFPGQASTTIFITHGHPEHLGGTLDHVRASFAGQSITIIASKTVCRYLAGERKRATVKFINAKPEMRLVLSPDISFEVFQWRHMPLLPPGLLAAVRHITHIVRRFREAWQIIKISLNGPKGPGDMLGYLLRLSEDENIIVYGEGLHRHSRTEDVAAIGRKALGAKLLVASEPEDFTEIPQLVTASGAFEAILYEPHRPWRDVFELPHIDLPALQKAILDTGVLARIPDRDGNHG